MYINPMEALDWMDRTLELAKKHNDLQIVASAYGTKAHILAQLGYFSKAVEALQHAQAAAVELLAGWTYLTMGETGLAMAQFFRGHQEAIADLEINLEKVRQYQNRSGEANTAHMLADCLIAIGELDQADQHLNRSANYYRQTQMTPHLLRALQSKLQVKLKTDRPDELQTIRVEIEKLRQSLSPGEGKLGVQA